MAINSLRDMVDKIKSKKKNTEVPWTVNVSRGEYELPTKNPLVFKLDTPKGKATVVLGKYKRIIVTSDISLKELLETEIVSRINHNVAFGGGKILVSVPWVKSVTKGYYTKKGMDTLDIKRRMMEVVAFVTDKGLTELPITTMINSNYIVIGEHDGLHLTDWSKYIVTPVSTYMGSINIVHSPYTHEQLKWVSELDWPLIEFSKPIEISGRKPPLKSREIGTTKMMKKAKGIMKLPCGNNNLYMYTANNDIYVKLNGIEHRAEAVPSIISGLDKHRLHTINTPELVACFVSMKGGKNAEAIGSAIIRVSDTPKTKTEAFIQKYDDKLVSRKLLCSDAVFINTSIGVKTEDDTLAKLSDEILAKFK